MEDPRNWDEVVLEKDDNFKINDALEQMVCLPPFRHMIPPHHIHRKFLEPSLCVVIPGQSLVNAIKVYRRRAYKPYKQVFTDGAYTKGKKATFAAVAIDENGECDGVTYGRTEEITPRCLIHELIGSKNGLELAREVSYEYLDLLMDSVQAKDLIQEVIKAGPINKEAHVALEKQKMAQIAFKGLLESVKVEPNWTWKQAVEVIKKDKRFGALRNLDRQFAFFEYINERKIVKAREDFVKMLEESKDLRVSTSWLKAMPKFKDDKRCQDVPEHKQEEIFDEFMLDRTKKLSEDKSWTHVVSKKGKKMTVQREDNAMKLLQKQKIKADIERVKAEVLGQIRDLIFTHWVKDGVVKIVVHSVPREGNFLSDTLTHVPMDFNHYRPVIKLRTDPGFPTDLICYFLYRNLFSYYIRYFEDYKFVRDKKAALKDNEESD